ncbi:patatin-like phospholipase family protein [Anaerobacterium chartisolvens]|uniref:patatin-like phospholipase family protein n=1 Tax=Anaerobacterium chartisolvens TaxID=1297424 RepID=UPI000DF4B50C|nr:patatin-like phospholipase family protein [Anaerobacterium chartisolvens]
MYRSIYIGEVEVLHVNKAYNIVLSGGGIKGVAYTGVFEAAEKEGIRWNNIAGVSAGALAGAFTAAGYSAMELKKVLSEFNFSKIQIKDIPKRVPAVSEFIEFNRQLTEARRMQADADKAIEYFLCRRHTDMRGALNRGGMECDGYRGAMLDNISKLSKRGYLCDGDYLEEWVSKSLLLKGVKTFGDLRTGKPDKMNPRGYKIRMTAVDINRVKMVVLPDDIAFYGMDPDKLEVAKAVRMSTAVPFAFKPVEIKKWKGNYAKKYSMIDGGVFDGFPYWLVDNENSASTLGFRLVGSDKKKLLSINTPLNILKALICAVHDIGVDKSIPPVKYVADINTSNISFLDFNLDEEEKAYLINEGRKAATDFFNKLNITRPKKKIEMLNGIHRFFRR